MFICEIERFFLCAGYEVSIELTLECPLTAVDGLAGEIDVEYFEKFLVFATVFGCVVQYSIKNSGTSDHVRLSGGRGGPAGV